MGAYVVALLSAALIGFVMFAAVSSMHQHNRLRSAIDGSQVVPTSQVSSGVELAIIGLVAALLIMAARRHDDFIKSLLPAAEEWLILDISDASPKEVAARIFQQTGRSGHGLSVR
jgi:hypothetical protein